MMTSHIRRTLGVLIFAALVWFVIAGVMAIYAAAFAFARAVYQILGG